MDYQKLEARAIERGLTEYQIAKLIHTTNSNAIEGYDSLSIDQNIDILLEAEKEFETGDTFKLLGLPVPPDLKERMAHLRSGLPASVEVRPAA
ncbi:MAG: hypothetical protein SFY92_00605 [Verrucomicrobiae bacterium]|nr:hypothetical protein [Verrucomicrobiae bacterium]